MYSKRKTIQSTETMKKENYKAKTKAPMKMKNSKNCFENDMIYDYNTHMNDDSF